jgi:hypothetical protein
VIIELVALWFLFSWLFPKRQDEEEQKPEYVLLKESSNVGDSPQNVDGEQGSQLEEKKPETIILETFFGQRFRVDYYKDEDDDYCPSEALTLVGEDGGVIEEDECGPTPRVNIELLYLHLTPESLQVAISIYEDYAPHMQRVLNHLQVKSKAAFLPDEKEQAAQ